LEVEATSFALYRRLLEAADGILVNADVESVLRSALGETKPILSLLRFAPTATVKAEPDPGPFSIAMITGHLGEWDDPTRMTTELVRSLLRQGLEIYYYSAVPIARAFQESLPPDEARHLHLRPPVRDQSDLIATISCHHAGWFVADMRACATLPQAFSTPFARALAASFDATTVATAGIYLGAAGLPTFFNRGHYTAQLFAPGTAIVIDPDEAGDVKAMIGARDWEEMRRAAFAAREQFTISHHIDRLVAWLDLHYPV
jgi:hypothetical protein